VGRLGRECRDCVLKAFELATDLLLGLAKPLLQTAEQFVVLTLGKGQVIVGELSVLLFEFAFDLVPTALEFQFCHAHVSRAQPGMDALIKSLIAFFEPTGCQLLDLRGT
jgi:hypothetical protein